MSAKPPFRADHVGSFLRPQPLLEARAQRDEGAITNDELRLIEDQHIKDVVRKQEEVGIKGVTDGEFRRLYFHVDFLEHLEGVEITYGDFFAYFQKDDGTEVGFRPPTMHVNSQIKHSYPIQGADFDFLAAQVTETPKVCIPAPSMLHFRGGRDAISLIAYPDLGDFFEDLTAAYRAEIADLAERGCRYLQLDDTNLAYLCDPEIRERTRARGEDPDSLAHLYARLVNDAIRDKPEDMVVGIHLCRGNFKSAWVSQGGYEPVADILFNEMDVDAFFLEYDDERSGDFAPLRLVPEHKQVILGLLSSKKAELEDVDDLQRRIEDAGQYIDLDQCGLSHQCGFSSTAHGNELTQADQWRKLELNVAVARSVWGD